MLEVIILGCGASLGVPVIACKCSVCTSELIYNKRTRCAIIIKDKDTNILVDFGFEIREQLIKADVTELDVAILTHFHADHVSGIDNLKTFSLITKTPLKIITDAQTIKKIVHNYQYMFDTNAIITEAIDFESKITIKSLDLQFFRQVHAPDLDSLGIRIKDFCYTNDVMQFPIESEKFLYNLKNWVIDCKGYNSSIFHFGLDKVIELYEKFKPKRLYLTNMGHEMDYSALLKELPNNIIPLYDGYVIKI